MCLTFFKSRPSAPVLEINNKEISLPCIFSCELKDFNIAFLSSMDISPLMIAYFLLIFSLGVLGDLVSFEILASVTAFGDLEAPPSDLDSLFIFISNESESSLNFILVCHDLYPYKSNILEFDQSIE